MNIYLKLKSNTFNYQKIKYMLTMYKIKYGRLSASIYLTNNYVNPFDTTYQGLDKTQYDNGKKSKIRK
jgi:hypothetical protein